MTQHIDADEALRLAQHEAEQQVLEDDVADREEAEETGKRLGDLEREIDRLKRQTVDGAVVERVFVSDGEGGISGVIDGRYGIQVKDHAQPTPTKPVMEDHSELGVVEVRWDGNVLPGTGEKPRGSKFGRVQTRHRLIEGGVQPDPEGPDWREGGAIGSYHGGTTIVSLGQPGQHAIWFYMAGPNNLEKSEFSEPLIVDVEPLVDRDEIQEWIDEKATELEEYVQDFGNRDGEQPPSSDDNAPAGVIYYQKNPAGQVLGIWQSQGDGEWIGLPLNSEVLVSVTTDKLVAGESLIDGVLIKDGAITLEKITVTEELVAEMARFLTVEADMIAANAIDGMSITGGALIGGEVVGGQLFIGERYVDGMSGNRGTFIDESGTYWHYGSDNTIDTRIDGNSNYFRGRFQTDLDGSSNISIEKGAIYGRAAVFFNLPQQHRPAQITTSTGDASDDFPPGTLDVASTSTVSSTPTGRMIVYPDGNFTLAQMRGTHSNIGIRKNGYRIYIQGQQPAASFLQSYAGRTSSSDQSTYNGFRRNVSFTPFPTGSRMTVATPAYIHSSAVTYAKIAVNRSTASQISMSAGETHSGTTWRIYYDTKWTV